MSDTAKSTRPSIDSNQLGLILAVITIIGANFASASFMSNSIRNEMDARFNAVDAQFEAVNAQFEAVNERLDGMDLRFDGVDYRLDRMDDRFDRVEEHLQRIDGQLYDFNGRLARVETGVFGYEPPAPPAADESTPLSATAPTPDPVADL